MISYQETSEEAKEQISLFIQNNNDYVTKVVELVKERATFVSDFWGLGRFFFVTPTTYDEKAVKKAWKEWNFSINERIGR